MQAKSVFSLGIRKSAQLRTRPRRLNHGEWLPWLKRQQESGAISFTERTASKYMRVASNRNHGSDLIEAPSIRAALELLSDSLQISSALVIWKASNRSRVTDLEGATSIRAKHQINSAAYN